MRKGFPFFKCAALAKETMTMGVHARVRDGCMHVRLTEGGAGGGVGGEDGRSGRVRVCVCVCASVCACT